MTMPKKFTADKLEGGPGASHENKKQPEKSKPHGELKTLDRKQGTRNARLKARVVRVSSLALITTGSIADIDGRSHVRDLEAPPATRHLPPLSPGGGAIEH
jgi:hypothetical protein